MDRNNLDRLETALDYGAPIPPDIRDWLLSGLNQFKNGECKTLCRALGLRAPGVSSLNTRRKLERRNDVIREIARQYPGTTWEKAVVIADRIHRYPYIGEEKPLYAVLFGLGGKVPTDKTGIYKILEK